jgi:hypothetical protein
VQAADPSLAGVYWVGGQVRGKRLTLSGANAVGMRLRWRALVKRQDTLQGRAKVKGPGRAKGMLVLTRRSADPPTNPPQSCDSSYFTTQVMGRVLQPICANCHVPGGAAQSANFRVTAGDPRATQESVDRNIDVANPTESRILQKPLNVVPARGRAADQPRQRGGADPRALGRPRRDQPAVRVAARQDDDPAHAG